MKKYSGKMKKYIPYLVIFLVGAFAGMWTHRQYYPCEPTELIQRDTVVSYDTLRYSSLELVKNTYKLDVPRIGASSLVFFPVDKVDTVYKDQKVYIAMEREYRYTETGDVQIWHSGIDSTIDSLNVISKSVEVTKTYKPKVIRNRLTAGMEVGYLTGFTCPVYLEYERMLHRNFGLYGRVSRDMRVDMIGVTVGARVCFGW